MAVKSTAEVTITDETDIDKLVCWYQLVSSTTPPSAPTTTQTSASVSNWTQNEPSFNPADGTRYLYTVWQTQWKDGSCSWGSVQLSSSYEQAKQAWNKANAAQSAAENANEKEQTIYIQAGQNAVSTNIPDGWVEYSGESTIATTVDDETTWSTPVWSTKPPAFCPEYPTILIATQRMSMDGTVTCTVPVIDDSNVVIDGGRIIAGSVSANAINATDLHVNAANIDGTLTASQINTEGLELSVSAITGLGNQLNDIDSQLNDKASASDVSDLAGTVGDMSDTVETALGEGGKLDKLRGDVDTIQAHISLGTIGEGSSLQPAITLDAEGGSSDGFRNVITNTSMSFMYGNETVAEVNKDELDITRTKVTESMQLGNFMWIPLSDGSLAFKWING